jgi:hypothetical protein
MVFFQDVYFAKINLLKLTQEEIDNLNSPTTIKVIKSINFQPSTVAHACKPNYWGGRDQEEMQLEDSLGKRFVRPHVSKKARHGAVCLSSQLPRRHK